MKARLGVKRAVILALAATEACGVSERDVRVKQHGADAEDAGLSQDGAPGHNPTRGGAPGSAGAAGSMISGGASNAGGAAGSAINGGTSNAGGAGGAASTSGAPGEGGLAGSGGAMAMGGGGLSGGAAAGGVAGQSGAGGASGAGGVGTSGGMQGSGGSKGGAGGGGGGGATGTMLTGTLGALGAVRPTVNAWVISSSGETLIYLSSAPLTCAMMQTAGPGWLPSVQTGAQVIEIVLKGAPAVMTYPVGVFQEVNYAPGGKSSSYEINANSGSITLTKAMVNGPVEGTVTATYAMGSVMGTFQAAFCPNASAY